MKRIRFTLSIGFPTAKRTEIYEFEDDTPQEVEEAAQEWANGYIDIGIHEESKR